MSGYVGYVVIEFNQASRQPEISADAPYLFDDAENAAEKCHALASENREVGRRERFAIGTVYIEED